MSILCSVSKSCLTLCNMMGCSTPGPLSFTFTQSLLKLMSIESVMPSNYLIFCHFFLFLPSIFPSIRVFSNESALHVRCQSIGVSASVLQMNIQGWFPLGLTGLIFLLCKVLLGLLANTTVQIINSFPLSLLYGSVLTSIHDYWKNHSFDYIDLCQQGDISAFLICCLVLS